VNVFVPFLFCHVFTPLGKATLLQEKSQWSRGFSDCFGEGDRLSLSLNFLSSHGKARSGLQSDKNPIQLWEKEQEDQAKMQELGWIWVNGELVKWQEAKTHVLTHALHYGTAVFEGIRCYKTVKGPAVFRLYEHIRRLFDSAHIIKMCLPYTPEEVKQATLQVIQANGVEECYIRPLAFRGYGEMGIDPSRCEVDFVIAVWCWGAYMGDKALREGVRAKISSYARSYINSSSPRAKTSANYLNSVLAKLEAKELGYDEAILLDVNGFVAEGSGENIFYVKNGVIFTPHPYAILLGITRDAVMQIAWGLGLEVRETLVTRDDLYLADEAFFTGTAAEITPLVEIDGRKIGDGKPGPITRRLQETFFRVVRGEEPAYEGWLTYVKGGEV